MNSDSRCNPYAHLFLPTTLLFSCAVLCMPAVAQNGISVGNGVSYDASVAALGVATDNYFYSDSNKVSSYGYSLQPRVETSYKQNTVEISLLADANYTQWDLPGRLGDIFSYGAGTKIAFAPLTRHNFAFSGDYRHGHDDAGAVRTEAQSQAQNQSRGLDEWQNLGASLSYRFGGESARANSQFSYSIQDRHYLTNRDLTAVLDNQSLSANYTLFYNYSPKTSWLFGVDRIDTRFDTRPAGTVSRDAVEYRFLTGIRWAATAKTSGDIRAGYFSREPSDRSQPTGGLDWSARLQWNPLATTGFELLTGRASSASYRTDTQFNNDRNASLSWTQTWTTRLSTRLGYTNTKSRLVGANTSDQTHNSGLSAEYAALPRLSFLASGSYLSRTSNQAGRSYDTLRGDLGMRLKL